MKILENLINGLHKNATRETLIIGGSGSGKTRFFSLPHMQGGPFASTDATNESGMEAAYERWSGMTPQDRRAEYASNNWRRMHGYPLKRREANKHRKEFSTEKMWLETFDHMEKNGWTLQFGALDETEGDHE